LSCRVLCYFVTRAEKKKCSKKKPSIRKKRQTIEN